MFKKILISWDTLRQLETDNQSKNKIYKNIAKRIFKLVNYYDNCNIMNFFMS